MKICFKIFDLNFWEMGFLKVTSLPRNGRPRRSSHAVRCTTERVDFREHVFSVFPLQFSAFGFFHYSNLPFMEIIARYFKLYCHKIYFFVEKIIYDSTARFKMMRVNFYFEIHGYDFIMYL